ncbi:ATP-binding protein [Yinghuangia sp. YIM S09857]|uniref:ATP-binding protein n=1 Tax=Yinghuangia sp. YIM S09857 TaxID=3436929 RepID=UPI003F5328FD
MSTPAHHVSATVRGFAQWLSSTPRGARLGRLLAADQLRNWSVPPDLAERAEHVVAELAANAVLHGGQPSRDFRLALILRPATGLLRIEVTDAMDELPSSGRPTPPGSERESGRGLLIVAALSNRWGIDPHSPSGKTVWAELGDSVEVEGDGCGTA